MTRFGLVRTASEEAQRVPPSQTQTPKARAVVLPTGGQSLRAAMVAAVGPKAVELGERQLRRLRMF